MTRFTPECLARTDFPRLIRDDSLSARQRLEALVTDPEALDLYGDELSSRGVAGRRLIDESGWDELRHRILREGLCESTLDDQTLSRLARDFEALAELQFDLFSTEVPRDPWKRSLALEAAGRGCSEIGCELRPRAQADDRGAWAEATESLPKPGNMKAETAGEGTIKLPVAPGPGGSSHRISPTAPAGDVEAVLGGGSIHAISVTRVNFQRCLVDRRGWLHWSNHLIDNPTSGPRVLLLVHCDTRAKSDLASLDGGLEWAWPNFDAITTACSHLLPLPPPPGFWPHASAPRRCRRECRREGNSWLRWIQRRVPFLRARNIPGEDPGRHALVEQIARFGGSVSTFDVHRAGERARSIVVVIDAAVELAIDDVIQRGEPDAATGLGIDTERYRGPYRPPDGRSPCRQLPAPKPPGTPRSRELASIV